MKRAKIILSVVAILAVVGGAFAFKASRFTGQRAWSYTFTVTLPEGVYYSTKSFCTSINNTVFLQPGLPNAVTLSSTAGPASTITLTDGLGHTVTIPFTSCLAKETRTTSQD